MLAAIPHLSSFKINETKLIQIISANSKKNLHVSNNIFLSTKLFLSIYIFCSPHLIKMPLFEEFCISMIWFVWKQFFIDKKQSINLINQPQCCVHSSYKSIKGRLYELT